MNATATGPNQSIYQSGQSTQNWKSLFFVLYFMVVVWFGTNIMGAVIIDAYVKVVDKRDRNAKIEKELENRLKKKKKGKPSSPKINGGGGGGGGGKESGKGKKRSSTGGSGKSIFTAAGSTDAGSRAAAMSMPGKGNDSAGRPASDRIVGSSPRLQRASSKQFGSSWSGKSYLEENGTEKPERYKQEEKHFRKALEGRKKDLTDGDDEVAQDLSNDEVMVLLAAKVVETETRVKSQSHLLKLGFSQRMMNSAGSKSFGADDRGQDDGK
jgi:hypothetical protein